jgi:hypothetical protein
MPKPGPDEKEGGGEQWAKRVTKRSKEKKKGKSNAGKYKKQSVLIGR